MLREIKKLCKHPFRIRGKCLWLHPEDLTELLKEPHFVGEWAMGVRKALQIGRIGMYWGYEVYEQDDIQRLLLAILGEDKYEDTD